MKIEYIKPEATKMIFAAEDIMSASIGCLFFIGRGSIGETTMYYIDDEFWD